MAVSYTHLTNIDPHTDEWVRAMMGNVFVPHVESVRQLLERTWMRNILYYLGEQWLVWYEGRQTFGRRYDMNINIPTPVSNIVREFVRSMKALTLNKQFVTRVWPNSESVEDKDAAVMGEIALRWMDSLNDNEIEDVKEHAEMWRIISGNAFLRVFPDTDTGRFVVNTKTGKTMAQPPEVGCDSIIPFNMALDPLGKSLNQKRYVGQKSLVYKEWVEDTFKIVVNSAEDIPLVDYERQLMQLVSNVSPWKGRGFESESVMMETPSEDLVVYKELEYRPTLAFPKGRYHSMAGDHVCVKRDDLPIPTAKDGSWNYSYTHFPYNHTPGSFWSTGGIDDLISPQNNINEIDQALATNRKSLGRPMVLTPSNVVLKRLSEKGQALLNIQWDARASQGAKPILQQGVPYPSQILDERKNHREVAQDSSGDPKNVLRGQAPTSSASGVLVDILRETAEQSHTPDITRFHRNWNKVNRKRLVLAQGLYRESRMIKIPGEGNQILIRKFKGADLRNNHDVRFEIDSGLSTTNAGRNQFFLNLVQGGFWGDLSQKPDVQRELLKRMGMAGFPEEQNVHRDRAEWENSGLEAGEVKRIALPNDVLQDGRGNLQLDGKGNIMTMFPITDDPLFRLDYHEIHINVHDQVLFSRNFQSWPEDRQLMAIAHRDLHVEAIRREQQQAVEEAKEIAEAQFQEAEQNAPPTPDEAAAAFTETQAGQQEGVPLGPIA